MIQKCLVSGVTMEALFLNREFPISSNVTLIRKDKHALKLSIGFCCCCGFLGTLSRDQLMIHRCLIHTKAFSEGCVSRRFSVFKLRLVNVDSFVFFSTLRPYCFVWVEPKNKSGNFYVRKQLSHAPENECRVSSCTLFTYLCGASKKKINYLGDKTVAGATRIGVSKQEYFLPQAVQQILFF